MESFESLALELSPRGFTRCAVAELHCKEHGDFRIAIAEAWSEESPCPVCKIECRFVVLGSSITERPLPFFEIPPGVTDADAGMRSVIRRSWYTSSARQQSIIATSR